MLKFKQASWNPRITSSNTRDTSSNPQVTISNSEFTSLNPRVQESLIYWKLKYTAFKFLLETEKRKSGVISVKSQRNFRQTCV